MTDKKKEIRDDEFRVIGKHPGSVNPDKRKKDRLIAAISLILVLLLGLIIYLKWPKSGPDEPENGIFDPVETPVGPEVEPFGQISDSTWTEKLDTMVNDVHLSLYLPHNATPELCLGVPSGEGIILAAQAADIRADNKKILGAFVLKGEPLAWGLSKKGFCAIIDGKVSVGVSENSPLFEEATDKGGYFFRQYPLVDNGTLVENEPKGKSMRKALCSRAGQIFIAISETDESFHDFAQSLIDLGVENAIYLVGGRASGGWWASADGTSVPFSPESRTNVYKNETYIVWR
jgi:hypothetical protein